MPNHFLTVGLCARDWQRLEELGREEFDFSTLEDDNLRERILPLPKDLLGIVSSSVPSRYRHKETGDYWIKDCNGPMGKDFDKWERVPLSQSEIDELTAKYGGATWYEWSMANWGTKWGIYELKVHELGGDGSPVLIEFQSAWGPPSSSMMEKITEFLQEEYCLTSITWVGHDPGCGETYAIAG